MEKVVLQYMVVRVAERANSRCAYIIGIIEKLTERICGMISDIQYCCLKEDYVLWQTQERLYLCEIKTGRPVAALSTGVTPLLLTLSGNRLLGDILEHWAKTQKIPLQELTEKVQHLLKSLAPFLMFSDNLISDATCPKLIIGDFPYHPVAVKSEKPLYVTFNITDRCSRNCIYCYMDSIYTKQMDNSHRFLSVERFADVLKECKDIGVQAIEVGGGDPLNHPQILEYVRLLSQSKIPNVLISTKKYVQEELALRFKEAGLREIQISLDSADKEIADILMGERGAYEEVVKTIHNFRKAGIDVKVNAVLTSLNCTNFSNLIQLLESMGVSTLSANYYGASCGRHVESLFPKVEQLQELKKQVDGITPSLKTLHLRMPDFQETFYENKWSSDRQIRSYYRSYCGAMKTRILVNPDGTVGYCAYITQDLSRKNGLIFGNLHTQSLMEIWQSPSVEDILTPNVQKFRGTLCADCRDFEKCYPKRCFLRSILQYDTPFEKDPDCRYWNDMHCKVIRD